MTYLPKPKIHHPALKKNSLGLTVRDYEGGLSTLCAGCGHDSVTASIIQAIWELGFPPHRVAKMSGIGCSSKTPGYFLNAAHGFNAVHGRMPSVTTGAYLANQDLTYLAVSGDGDTASIGIGQFIHAMRRHLNMVYICENNGAFGLTKGQFSATADLGSRSKRGDENPFEPLDPALLGLELGATFVAKSFSGDKEQLVPLIKAAFKHRGFALIDVLSPCVAFNNHEGSTKSYAHIRSHEREVTHLDYIPAQTEITINYPEGSGTEVDLPDGSRLRLRKIDATYDPRDRILAAKTYREYRARGEIMTGLLYLDEKARSLHDILGTIDTPLNEVPYEALCPGKNALDEINRELR